MVVKETPMPLRPSKQVKDPLDDIRKLDTIECGAAARKAFAFPDGYRNLNHGSFGTYPNTIRSTFHRYADLSEERPDAFIRYDYPRLLDESREAIADFVHAPVDACVLISNATTGINIVLRNLVFKPGDVIIYFATIYGACGKTISYITETTPAESKQVEYTYPASDDALCSAFEDVIKDIKAQGKNPRLAIYDTIASLPGVRMPFERLTALCKDHGIFSLVDAAHSVGGIPIDLGKLDPDAYVTNLHKWLFVPRGCALFYVPVRNQHLMRSTLPTSHGFVPQPTGDGSAAQINPLPPGKNSAYVENYKFAGTLDNSPYLCVPAAIEWRKKLTWQGKHGEDAICGYLDYLAQKAGKLVSTKLGTDILDNDERTLTKCFFNNVRLPLDYQRDAAGDFATAVTIAQWMSRVLVEEYDTFMAFLVHGDSWWVRLSAQVYLVEEDFEWSAAVLEKLCARVKEGEWNKK
ncbi:hypothetical protein LTR95_002480 [Oleoguttula sp. CCFEE 5521]